MKQERKVSVEGTEYQVVISDERETLLAARAAGRVPVGLYRETGNQDLSAARYLVGRLDSVDEQYLERVVRREKGLPWKIGESERLILREFTMADLQCVPKEAGDRDADRVFYTPDKLEAYIRGQYGFYEYGLWAAVRKSDGRLIGKAGITGCGSMSRNEPEDGERGSGREKADDGEGNKEWYELGYHIFTPYRRQGYAKEACRIILDYAAQEYGSPVYADVECGNTASIALLEKLGFGKFTERKYTESDALRYRYVWKMQ